MSERGRSPAPPGAGGSGASRSSSRSPARPGAVSGWTKPLGYDPAKPPRREEKGNTRMELPPDAYVVDSRKDMFTLRGNKLNTEGRPEMIEVNQLKMTKFDFSKTIYQYDIVLSRDVDKLRPVMKKIWAHPAMKQALARYNFPLWIFDGTKLAWAPCLVERGELRLTIDLDEGRARPGGSRQDNRFMVIIRQTTQIDISVLQGYLDRRIQFSNNVQEALNFMDHLIRQWPSQNLLAIRRNFYQPNDAPQMLQDGAVVEVRKGAYASVRLSHNLNRGGIGLAMNVDVANTCFWVGRQPLDILMINFLATVDRRWKGLNNSTIGPHFRPVMGRTTGQWQSSDAFKTLRRLRRLKFTLKYDKRTPPKVLTIEDFAFDQKYGEDGGSSRKVTFDYNGRMISVYDFYREKYNITLKLSNLPLINAGKNGFIPIECAIVQPMQRYAFKLNPDQTAAMIKIAVTRPDKRKAEIQKNVHNLQITKDPYLNYYGVQFEPSFTKTEAKVLAPPRVNFAQGGVVDPKFSGRWDLRGKKFYLQNKAPLQSWGFIAMDNCICFPELKQFADTFTTTFRGHGGKVMSDAMLINISANFNQDPANALKEGFDRLYAAKGYPQLIFIIVKFKNSPHYERLKKSGDCRFGILTQVLNAASVKQNNGQYHSNVCMKVNAKLGGATSRTMPPWKSTATYFPKNRPTAIIGVDVSHTSPGGNSASVAAMTMSVDREANRYAAMVETNGYRMEIISPKNVHFFFGQLLKQFRVGHEGAFPQHIIYFRDGVSEGQFAQVLDQEIAELKRCFQAECLGKLEPPKFTVIVATKRHHIRFFPQNGDKNGNPKPGTLVEKEVTHPFMWDFYLCSHVAIQGTARPVHYHVILDEMNSPVNDLQKMIYHQCYSYARSTTPVSLHPAVYYAHLAGSRARAHENVAASEGGFRHGGKGHELIIDKVAKGITTSTIPSTNTAAPALLTLGGKITDGAELKDEKRQRDFFRSTMWYV